MDRSKKHNNSFSLQKENKKLGNKNSNQSNPIFINIISNSPFQNNINEKNELEMTISNKIFDKKIKNSNTTKILISKSNNNKNPFINNMNKIKNNI